MPTGRRNWAATCWAKARNLGRLRERGRVGREWGERGGLRARTEGRGSVFVFLLFCFFLFQSLFRTVENKSENILTLIKTTH